MKHPNLTLTERLLAEILFQLATTEHSSCDYVRKRMVAAGLTEEQVKEIEGK